MGNLLVRNGNLLVGNNLEVEEWQIKNIGYSREYNLSHWDRQEIDKNIEYYFTGNRFTKIPLKFYSQYTHGFWYGFYEDTSAYDQYILI